VIHNPLQSIFCEPWQSCKPRNYLTYVGRLIPAKNLHRLLPAMQQLLEEDPELRVCIIGEGPQRRELEALVSGSPRVEFLGTLDPVGVRAYLRKTKVFVSGCQTEALGLAYVEALSQGCAVAMPACGGGLEIAPDLIGNQIHLLPLSFCRAQVAGILQRALKSTCSPPAFEVFVPDAVAAAYVKCYSHKFSKAPAAWQQTEMLDRDSDAH
jgi:glycosyltransferase involved in cell wall biosynthesis